MAERQAKPPKTTSKYDWAAITARLRRRPDTWIEVIQQGPRSLDTSVKRQRMLAVRDAKWDYTSCTRNTHGNRADLWMMASKKQEE